MQTHTHRNLHAYMHSHTHTHTHNIHIKMHGNYTKDGLPCKPLLICSLPKYCPLHLLLIMQYQQKSFCKLIKRSTSVRYAFGNLARLGETNLTGLTNKLTQLHVTCRPQCTADITLKAQGSWGMRFGVMLHPAIPLGFVFWNSRNKTLTQVWTEGAPRNHPPPQMTTWPSVTSFTRGNIPMMIFFHLFIVLRERGINTSEQNTIVLVDNPYSRKEGGYAFLLPMLSGI